MQNDTLNNDSRQNSIETNNNNATLSLNDALQK
jgi:hypothetical protein